MYRIEKSNLKEYVAIIYASSYDSPISYLSEIESQLRQMSVNDGIILFDTLLSKGNTSKRFFEVKFEDGSILKPTFKNIDIGKKSQIRKVASEFYRDSGINLDNSLLTDTQKKIITKGFVL